MIRRLTLSDADQYQKLRFLSLKTDPQAFLATHNQESTYPISYYSSTIKNCTKPPIFGIYGVFENNQLIANARLSPDYFPKTQHLCNIFEVYVHPDYRGQQIAQKILKHLIIQAKTYPQLEQIHLKVNSQNTKAIALYKKLNFKHIATRPKVIKENNSYQDEFMYCLDINKTNKITNNK